MYMCVRQYPNHFFLKKIKILSIGFYESSNSSNLFKINRLVIELILTNVSKKDKREWALMCISYEFLSFITFIIYLLINELADPTNKKNLYLYIGHQFFTL